MLRFARQQIGKPFSGIGMLRSLIWPRTPDGSSWCAAEPCRTSTPARASHDSPRAQVLRGARGRVLAGRGAAEPRLQPRRRDAAEPVPSVPAAGRGSSKPVHPAQPVRHACGTERRGTAPVARCPRSVRAAGGAAGAARRVDPRQRQLAARSGGRAATRRAAARARRRTGRTNGQDAEPDTEQHHDEAAEVASGGRGRTLASESVNKTVSGALAAGRSPWTAAD